MGQSKAGRNDPCPCGSGRKYKHCCLADQRPRPSQLPSSGAGIAIDWLWENHPSAVGAAIDRGFFGVFGPQQIEELFGSIPADLTEVIEHTMNEWLLAEAVLELEAGRIRTADLFLGPGGPRLDVAQREWLLTLASWPLTVYEVVESRPGEGMVLKSALSARSPRLEVRERLASEQLVRGSVFGGRLLPIGDERWELSGIVYPLEHLDLDILRRAVRRKRPTAVSETIRDLWLQRVAQPFSPPNLVSAATGEPMLMVTDLYRITDWPGLVRALAKEPDVEGDRDDGWIRFIDPEAEILRPRVALNPGAEPDQLELFAHTLGLADESRDWFRKVAGVRARFLDRRIVDPVSEFLSQREGSQADHPARPVSPPLEVSQEFLQKAIEAHYHHWADQDVPALDGLTPREALATRTMRQRVIDLLKMYEHKELEAAHREGRESASYEFLWKSVGLSRGRYI
ncbi:MAG: SEC-C domain-containing protein [Acidobacteriota bacterium]